MRINSVDGQVLKTPSRSQKALVYHGLDKRDMGEQAAPTIQDPGDAMVRITASTICGTDLHILKGDLPVVIDGRNLDTRASVTFRPKAMKSVLKRASS